MNTKRQEMTRKGRRCVTSVWICKEEEAFVRASKTKTGTNPCKIKNPGV